VGGGAGARPMSSASAVAGSGTAVWAQLILWCCVAYSSWFKHESPLVVHLPVAAAVTACFMALHPLYPPAPSSSTPWCPGRAPQWSRHQQAAAQAAGPAAGQQAYTQATFRQQASACWYTGQRWCWYSRLHLHAPLSFKQ
jgi:hypothetical protein